MNTAVTGIENTATLKRAVPRPRLSDAPPELHRYIQPPVLALPTVALCVVASTGLIGAMVMVIQGSLSYPVAGLIVGICHYWLFTVLHDASHRAISGKYDWINNRVGDWVSILMLPVFLINANFRYMHMQHHRFANSGPEHDPDDWAGGGSNWTLPLRWMTIPYRYIYFYLKSFPERPTKEKLHIIATTIAGAAAIYWMVQQGWGEALFWAYFVPIHFSFGFLAMAFDWLPHYPHDVAENDDPYQATVVREGAAWIMTPLLLAQNYHLLHHLYPRVPFYNYSRVWYGMREQLLEKGSRVVSPLGMYKP